MKHPELKDIEKTLVHKQFPPSVILDSINRCNYNCSICARRQMTREMGKMDFQTAKKIIDEISIEDSAIKVWLVFYGEPLLIKERIYYISDYAGKKGIQNLNLNTNGSLLNDDAIELLLDSSISNIIISIDAFSDEQYSKIRKQDNRNLVYNNVEKFINKNNKLSIKKNIYTQIVRDEQSDEEIEKFILYWKNLGAIVKIKDKVNWTESAEKIDFSKRIACPWIFNTLPILFNGDMVICGADYNGKCIVGNIHKNSIKEVWNNYHLKLRDLHLNHNFLNIPDICKGCSDWNVLGSEII